uniref:Uncharacterized protein n=1 Tax=Megaselia scalaris TaxID=36166 RepID=T1GZU0_MEGSC
MKSCSIFIIPRKIDRRLMTQTEINIWVEMVPETFRILFITSRVEMFRNYHFHWNFFKHIVLNFYQHIDCTITLEMCWLREWQGNNFWTDGRFLIPCNGLILGILAGYPGLPQL